MDSGCGVGFMEWGGIEQWDYLVMLAMVLSYVGGVVRLKLRKQSHLIKLLNNAVEVLC